RRRAAARRAPAREGRGDRRVPARAEVQLPPPERCGHLRGPELKKDPMTTVATHVDAHVEHEEDTSLRSWLTTVDHKRIGKLYLFTALTFFGIGGFEALLIRLQLMF